MVLPVTWRCCLLLLRSPCVLVIVKFGIKSIVKCVSAEPVGGEKERELPVAINNALSGARIEHGSWMVSSVV